MIYNFYAYQQHVEDFEEENY